MALTPRFRHFLCLAIITLYLPHSSSQIWSISTFGPHNNDDESNSNTATNADAKTRDVQVEKSGLVRYHTVGERNRRADSGVYTLESRESQFRGVYKISLADEKTAKSRSGSGSGSGQGRSAWLRGKRKMAAVGGRGVADLRLSSRERLLAYLEEVNRLLEATLADEAKHHTPGQVVPSPYTSGKDGGRSDHIPNRQTYVIPITFLVDTLDHDQRTTPGLATATTTTTINDHRRRAQNTKPRFRQNLNAPSPLRNRGGLEDQDFIRFLVQRSDENDASRNPPISFRPDATPLLDTRAGLVAGRGGGRGRGEEGGGAGVKRGRDPFVVLEQERVPWQDQSSDTWIGPSPWSNRSRKQRTVPDTRRTQRRSQVVESYPLPYQRKHQRGGIGLYQKLGRYQDVRPHPLPIKGSSTNRRRLQGPHSLPLPSVGSDSYPFLRGEDNQVTNSFPISNRAYKTYPFLSRVGNQGTGSISFVNRGKNRQSGKRNITKPRPSYLKETNEKQERSTSKTSRGTNRPTYTASPTNRDTKNSSGRLALETNSIANRNKNIDFELGSQPVKTSNKTTQNYAKIFSPNQAPKSRSVFDQRTPLTGGRPETSLRSQNQSSPFRGQWNTGSSSRTTSTLSHYRNTGVSPAHFPAQNNGQRGSPFQPIVAHKIPTTSTSISNLATVAKNRKRRSAPPSGLFTHDTLLHASPFPSRSNKRGHSQIKPAHNARRDRASSPASDEGQVLRLIIADSNPSEPSSDRHQPPNTRNRHRNDFHGRNPNFHPPVKTEYKSPPSPPTSRSNVDVSTTPSPENAHTQSRNLPENAERKRSDRNQNGRNSDSGRHVHGRNPEFKSPNADTQQSGPKQRARGNKNNGNRNHKQQVPSRRRSQIQQTERRKQSNRRRHRQDSKRPVNPFLLTHRRTFRRKRETNKYTYNRFDFVPTPQTRVTASSLASAAAAESLHKTRRGLKKAPFPVQRNSPALPKLHSSSRSQQSPFAPFGKNREAGPRNHPLHASVRDIGFPKNRQTHNDTGDLGRISTAPTWTRSFPRSPYSSPDNKGREAAGVGSRLSEHNDGFGYQRSAGSPYRTSHTYDPRIGGYSVHGPDKGVGRKGGGRSGHGVGLFSPRQRASRYNVPAREGRLLRPRVYSPNQDRSTPSVHFGRRNTRSDGYISPSQRGVVPNTPVTRRKAQSDGYYSSGRGRFLYKAPTIENDVTAFLEVYNNDDSSTKNPAAYGTMSQGISGLGVVGSDGDVSSGNYLQYDPTTKQLSFVSDSGVLGVTRMDDLQGAYFQYNPETQELKIVTNDEEFVNNVVNNGIDGGAATTTTSSSTTTTATATTATTSTTANNFSNDKATRNLIARGSYFQHSPSTQGVGVNIGDNPVIITPNANQLPQGSYIHHNPYAHRIKLQADDGSNSIIISANSNGFPPGSYFQYDPSAAGHLSPSGNWGRSSGDAERQRSVYSAQQTGLPSGSFYAPHQSNLVGIFQAEDRTLANQPRFFSSSSSNNNNNDVGYIQFDPTSTSTGRRRWRRRGYPGSGGIDEYSIFPPGKIRDGPAAATPGIVDSNQGVVGYVTVDKGTDHPDTVGYIQFDPTTAGTGATWPGGRRSHGHHVPRGTPYPTSLRPLVRPGPDLFLRIFHDGGVFFDEDAVIQNYYTDGDYERMLRHFRALPLESVQSRNGVMTGTLGQYHVTACSACGPENRPMIEFVTPSTTSPRIVRRFHYRQSRHGGSSGGRSSSGYPSRSPFVVRPEREPQSVYLGTYPYKNQPKFGVPSFRDKMFDDTSTKRRKQMPEQKQRN